jgi:hypothetical protein
VKSDKGLDAGKRELNNRTSTKSSQNILGSGLTYHRKRDSNSKSVGSFNGSVGPEKRALFADNSKMRKEAATSKGFAPNSKLGQWATQSFKNAAFGSLLKKSVWSPPKKFEQSQSKKSSS